jgi:hypothetical protein
LSHRLPLAGIVLYGQNDLTSGRTKAARQNCALVPPYIISTTEQGFMIIRSFTSEFVLLSPPSALPRRRSKATRGGEIASLNPELHDN